MAAFRTDINGLRAYAVIAVLIFHCNRNWLTGGFVGVDVFFVISGYLMTKIIVTKIASNNFSLNQFYLDRANRIIPALIVVCASLSLFGWFKLTPMDLTALGHHSAGSIFLFPIFNIGWRLVILMLHLRENGCFTHGHFLSNGNFTFCIQLFC